MTKLMSFEAQNVLRLKAVRLELNGDSVVITGANDQGKTSVLRGIEMLLTGKSSVPSMPVREGQETGYVVGTFGDLVVRRVFTATDSYLSVENAEGMKHKSPQDILNRMLGRDGRDPVIAFDPLEFGRMKPVEQRAVLLRLVKLDINMEQYGDVLRLLEHKRTEANSLLSHARGDLQETPDYPEDTPAAKVSMASLVSEMDKVAAIKLRNEQARAKYTALQDELVSQTTRVRDQNNAVMALREQIKVEEVKFETLKAEAQDIEQKIVSQATRIRALEDPDDQRLRERIATVEEINDMVEFRLRREKARSVVKERESAAKGAQGAVEAHRNSLRSAIEASDMPIEGLSVSENGVLFDGIPFDQLSDSKKLKVSLAIAMAMNPTLRLILIDRLELLDDENQAVVAKMTEEHGYQFIATKVSSSPEGTGVHIVDGEVAP